MKYNDQWDFHGENNADFEVDPITKWAHCNLSGMYDYPPSWTDGAISICSLLDYEKHVLVVYLGGFKKKSKKAAQCAMLAYVAHIFGFDFDFSIENDDYSHWAEHLDLKLFWNDGRFEAWITGEEVEAAKAQCELEAI